MHSQHPFIQITELTKTYMIGEQAVHALKPTSLTIEVGQSVAIMGSSGSGKSTLLHLLGCLDSPTSGRYLFNQQEVSSLDDRALSLLRASQMGFVFQAFHLIPQLNVFENVEVPFLYGWCILSQLQIRERILYALEKVQLQHRLHHLPSQLSGGEMQRVAIARALAISPLLILADEPTGNLDTETGEGIIQLFQELHQQGSTLLIVTHDERVGRHCQRILRMCDGSIVADEQQALVNT